MGRLDFRSLRLRLQRTYVLLWMEEHAARPARSVRFSLLAGILSVVLGLSAFCGLVFLLIAYTPLRELIPGYGSLEARQQARIAMARVAMLEDSLRAQTAYLESLRQVLLGEFRPEEPPTESPAGEAVPLETYAPFSDPSPNTAPGVRRVLLGAELLGSLLFPAPPPLDGVVTRGLDPRIGHWGIDIAAAEGQLVRAIADGFVVFADWTQQGGYTIVLQHADNVLSVYKHNQRLLRSVGERVRAGETIALSGRSGEVTTGPHLHFELWHAGIPLDPLAYLYGLRSVLHTTDR
nr:MAG: peptidase M24 [Bacteroidota bacterium]